MKTIKLTIFSILGATLLGLGLYSCSNDDTTGVNELEKTNISKNVNRKVGGKLSENQHFINYVKLTNTEFNLPKNIDKIKSIYEDKEVDETEIYDLSSALGYLNIDEFQTIQIEKIKNLDKLNAEFNLLDLKDDEIAEEIIIVEENLGITTNSNCERRYRNCRIKVNAAAVIAHIGCGAIDTTVITGIGFFAGVACHSAVLTMTYAELDNCRMDFEDCK